MGKRHRSSSRKRRTTAPPPDGRMDQQMLAARWRNSPRTLEKWRWKGLGPPYLKIGGRVIYRRADIEAYEASQVRRPTLAAPASAPGAEPAGTQGDASEPLP